MNRLGCRVMTLDTNGARLLQLEFWKGNFGSCNYNFFNLVQNW